MRRSSAVVIALGVVFAGGLTLLLNHFAFSTKPGVALPAVHDSCRRTSVLNAYGTRLRYPSCWTRGNFADGSLETTFVAFLSNQSMHKPCTTKHSGIGTTTSCGFPLKRLEHGGVLVMFVEGGSPGWSVANESGRPLLVDHHEARESVTQGPLRSIDATVEQTIYIDAGVPDNYYQLAAFFRGPGVTNDERLFQGMLKSLMIR